MHVSNAGTSSVEGHSSLSICFRGHEFICQDTVVDCVGYGLNAIVTFQQHGLRVVPFVVLSSVWCPFHRKDSWRERRTQHARRRKSIASDAALAGRSQLSVCCHSASFKKCARNCSQTVVCTTCERCSEVLAHLLQAVTGQQRQHTTTIECVCGPSRGFRSVRFASWFHESLMFSNHPAPSTRRTLRRSEEPTGEFGQRLDAWDRGSLDVHHVFVRNIFMCDTCIAKPPCLAIATSGFEG